MCKGGTRNHAASVTGVTPLREWAVKTSIAAGDHEPDQSDQLRQAIVKVLGARFGTIPLTIVERIDQTDGNARLSVLFDRALIVDTLDEFSQALV